MATTIENETISAAGLSAILFGHFEHGPVAWNNPVGHAKDQVQILFLHIHVPRASVSPAIRLAYEVLVENEIACYSNSTKSKNIADNHSQILSSVARSLPDFDIGCQFARLILSQSSSVKFIADVLVARKQLTLARKQVLVSIMIWMAMRSDHHIDTVWTQSIFGQFAYQSIRISR